MSSGIGEWRIRIAVRSQVARGLRRRRNVGVVDDFGGKVHEVVAGNVAATCNVVRRRNAADV